MNNSILPILTLYTYLYSQSSHLVEEYKGKDVQSKCSGTRFKRPPLNAGKSTHLRQVVSLEVYFIKIYKRSDFVL
jgi:hypothetical protein